MASPDSRGPDRTGAARPPHLAGQVVMCLHALQIRCSFIIRYPACRNVLLQLTYEDRCWVHVLAGAVVA
jgi:hypothetical protein